MKDLCSVCHGIGLHALGLLHDSVLAYLHVCVCMRMEFHYLILLIDLVVEGVGYIMVNSYWSMISACQ